MAEYASSDLAFKLQSHHQLSGQATIGSKQKGERAIL